MRMFTRLVALSTAALAMMVGLAVAPAASAASTPVPLPVCCAHDTVGYGGNVYTLALPPGGTGPEQPVLIRIDPATNSITGSLTLPSGASTGDSMDTRAMAVAAHSIWVTSYFRNEVLRIDPRSMSVTAAISVGRSPDSIVSDGSSLWVALQNNRSVIEIDPADNSVVRTVRVDSKDSSDGPYQLAYSGSDVLASMPVSGRVARIDPSTGRVRYDLVGADAASCARILPASGGYWLDDTECSQSYYRWNARTKRISTVLTPPAGDWGAVIVRGALYTGEYMCNDTGCTHGKLVKRNVVTGAEISHRGVGIEAFLPHYAAGAFWVADFDDSALLRADHF